ncbi:MAG: carbohydrate ABC transporter permease, partial [Anaerolineales bacterium]|nr:carbohydrate ABC transporter permease [Anaerolineales bacterium]
MIQRRKAPLEVLRYGLIIVVLLWTVFPLAWLFLTSFKQPNDIMVMPPRFVFRPTLDNYVYAFGKANFALFIGNTLYVSLLSTFFVIVLASLAAYSFARYNVGGGNILFFILTTKMMPAIAVVLPFFLIFRDVGATTIGQFLGIGLDRRGALVISYTIFNLPFAIWLMVSFFQDISRELEDSARLNGYSRLQVLQKVVLPLAAPGIAVTAIFCLIFSWNEFLFAYILTRDAARTITVGVESFFTLR